jgi:uncharacterized coiled-coil DUF342 family protein
MASRYSEEANQLKEEIFLLHRKMITPIHEYNSIHDEDDIMHNELTLLISQAISEGIDPSEAEELKAILREVEISHQNTMQEVVSIIAKLN